MPTTIATIRARVRQDLHDEDSSAYRWTDAVLDRHIGAAVNDYSLYCRSSRRPRSPRLPAAAISTPPPSRTSSPSRRSSGRSDSSRRRSSASAAGRPPSPWTRQTSPRASRTCTSTGRASHTLDGSTSTLPVAHEDIIAIGAAAHAALDWTSFATNRINTGGDDVWGRYKAFGESRMRDFRRALARNARNNRVRARRMFTTEAPAPLSQDRVYGP